MTYNFSNLSPADFEDLSRELVGKELGIRFESFAAGPDGGIDGRHAAGNKSTILQAKHYAGSNYSTLKSAIKREVKAAKKLNPTNYVLTTSLALTPKNKEELSKLFGKSFSRRVTIFTRSDLNSLLRDFPEVEKAHIKLWLSSSAVLDRVVRSASHAFSTASKAEIEAKVKVYAQNPSFKDAKEKLETNHVAIISGPPGVGKTTLAEMLSYAYIGEEWEFVAIRNLDDGFAAINDTKKQIFFFDDFLGKIALDARALAAKDFELAKFIKRIQRTKNARFILTTRAYIFEEARRASEYLADDRLNIMKYVLDVGVYTRRIRARILYNHLYVHKLPIASIRELINSRALAKIVDHANYNPRIIEWMTDVTNVKTVPAKNYPKVFIESLDHPSRVWDTAFRSHIPTKCQNLLFALFFCSEYGVDAEDLRTAFEPLNQAICRNFGQSHTAKDFEEALKILEGSFVKIADGSVSFINPSVRDYLANYLQDKNLLSIFPPVAQSVRWARELWEHFKKIPDIQPEETDQFTRRFKKIAQKFNRFPIWKKVRNEPGMLRYFDDSNTTRLELLLEWWNISHLKEYSAAALAVATNPTEGYTHWLDGEDLVRIIVSLKSDDQSEIPSLDNLTFELEGRLISILESNLGPDELRTLVERIDDAPAYFSRDVFDAINRAINSAIDDADFFSTQVDSESIVDDHSKAIKALGKRANVQSDRVEMAVAAYQSRKQEISEAVEEEKPSFSGNILKEKDKFNDTDLQNLFSLLISK